MSAAVPANVTPSAAEPGSSVVPGPARWTTGALTVASGAREADLREAPLRVDERRRQAAVEPPDDRRADVVAEVGDPAGRAGAGRVGPPAQAGLRRAQRLVTGLVVEAAARVQHVRVTGGVDGDRRVACRSGSCSRSSTSTSSRWTTGAGRPIPPGGRRSAGGRRHRRRSTGSTSRGAPVVRFESDPRAGAVGRVFDGVLSGDVARARTRGGPGRPRRGRSRGSRPRWSRSWRRSAPRPSHHSRSWRRRFGSCLPHQRRTRRGATRWRPARSRGCR